MAEGQSRSQTVLGVILNPAVGGPCMYTAYGRVIGEHGSEWLSIRVLEPLSRGVTGQGNEKDILFSFLPQKLPRPTQSPTHSRTWTSISFFITMGLKLTRHDHPNWSLLRKRQSKMSWLGLARRGGRTPHRSPC